MGGGAAAARHGRVIVDALGRSWWVRRLLFHFFLASVAAVKSVEQPWQPIAKQRPFGVWSRHVFDIVGFGITSRLPRRFVRLQKEMLREVA